MKEHPDGATLRAFLRGELTPEETLAVDDHVSACAACASALSPRPDFAARAADEALFDSHLTYEQLEAALDTPNEHVLHCRRCAEDLDDLRAMQRRSRAWRYWPVAAAAAIAGALFLYTSRDDTPAPAPRPTPPPLTRPTPAPRPDPLASLSAPLRATLEQLAAGTIPKESLLRTLHPPRERLRSTTADDVDASLFPIGVVASAQPLFEWDAVRNATYSVSVANTRMDVVARASSLSASSWRPPAALPRGEILTWQVTVHTADGERRILPTPPAPPARLYVITRDAERELASAPDSLSRGLLYAREGMLDDAEKELRVYAQAHPEVELAVRALENVRARALRLRQ